MDWWETAFLEAMEEMAALAAAAAVVVLELLMEARPLKLGEGATAVLEVEGVEREKEDPIL